MFIAAKATYSVKDVKRADINEALMKLFVEVNKATKEQVAKYSDHRIKGKLTIAFPPNPALTCHKANNTPLEDFGILVDGFTWFDAPDIYTLLTWTEEHDHLYPHYLKITAIDFADVIVAEGIVTLDMNVTAVALSACGASKDIEVDNVKVKFKKHIEEIKG